MLAVRAAAFLLTAGLAGGGGAYALGRPAALHLPGQHPVSAGCSSDAGRPVCQLTRDPHLRTAMLLGALIESGRLNAPWRCGDHGWACGPWQINRSPTAHPDVTRAQSSDPDWAARYMLHSYRAACTTIPAVRWQTDPRGAAATCVYRAEHPTAMYSARRVADAWAHLESR